MTGWRKTFGFDLSFSEVHQRYRQTMWETTDITRIRALGDALEQARQELGTSPPSTQR